MSPRPRKNSTDVAGLYEKFDAELAEFTTSIKIL